MGYRSRSAGGGWTLARTRPIWGCSGLKEKTPRSTLPGAERGVRQEQVTLSSSATSYSSTDFWRCPKPLRGGARACYSRRCACQNCRNKACWKEYITLVRSLEWRPATHFVSLVLPWHYTGHDITQRMNQFVKVLRRRLGCGEILHHWRYDSQTRGRWPHVHQLLRVGGVTIAHADVFAAWREVWGEDEVVDAADAHVRECDSDFVETARYFTKHGEQAKQVKKQEWGGRLSGGTTRFFATSRKSLFGAEVYRDEYEDSELAALMERFVPMWESRVTAATPIEMRAGKDRAGVGSSLFFFSSPLPLDSRSSRLPFKRGPRPPANFRVTLAHCLYPIPPPGLIVGGEQRRNGIQNCQRDRAQRWRAYKVRTRRDTDENRFSPSPRRRFEIGVGTRRRRERNTTGTPGAMSSSSLWCRRSSSRTTT